MIGEQRNVLDALAQRGQPDRDDVDSVKQVLAKRPLATIFDRLRLVAAMTRMSASTSSVPPSRRYLRSWSTRSSFTWTSGLISPISSRKIEPFSATSISPFLLVSRRRMRLSCGR